ncbi:MAG TPA: chloride channel protein, partial [Candidatus Pullilachnospira stercoravium]|nr:chloride channel protein [Candidatus Pullilachnospira stercoravium]
MKKDTSHILQRAEHLKTILIGEGLLVGIVAGFVVLSYRLLLEVAQKLLNRVIAAGHRQPWVFALWFLALVLLAFVVSRLLRWEPLISGSGIPQLEGEMTGKLNQTWWKVLPAKFAGGFLCLLGGLSLGREGPSIQLGAMAGKAVSRAMDRGKTEEKYLLTCGASAGLAAAFHAPLAGVMFSLEEIHKNFSVSVLICVMTASLTADLISSSFLGFEPVFQFHIGQELEPQFYWHLLILGILLGLAGVFYNWLTLKTQSLIQDNPRLNTFTRLLIPFLLAGVLAMVYPQILGSGHDLVMEAAS